MKIKDAKELEGGRLCSFDYNPAIAAADGKYFCKGHFAVLCALAEGLEQEQARENGSAS